MKKKVLFVSEHNAARSQMAAAFFGRLCGHEFEAYSAGIDPWEVDPLAVEVMREIGLDISGNKTLWVYDFIRPGLTFDYVITICEQVEKRCPIFTGRTERLLWNFPAPSSLNGSYEEKLAQMRKLRDSIQTVVNTWARKVCPEPPLVSEAQPNVPKELR